MLKILLLARTQKFAEVFLCEIVYKKANCFCMRFLKTIFAGYSLSERFFLLVFRPPLKNVSFLKKRENIHFSKIDV